MSDDQARLITNIFTNDTYFSPRKRVLDIGCGRGKFLNTSATRNIEAYGVDLRAVYKGDNLVLADAYKLPFKDDSFDAVLANWFFNDLKDLQNITDKDLMPLEDEIKRVIQPQGILLVGPGIFTSMYDFEPFYIPELKYLLAYSLKE